MPSRSLLPVVLSLSSLLLSLNVYLSAAPSLSARLAPRPWPASSPSVEFSRCMARPPARRAPYLSMAGRSYPFPWPRAVLCSFQAAPSHLLFSLPRSRHSSPPRPTPSVSLARRLSSLLLPLSPTPSRAPSAMEAATCRVPLRASSTSISLLAPAHSRTPCAVRFSLAASLLRAFPCQAQPDLPSPRRSL